MAQSLHARPSDLLHIKDDMTRFYLDRAVWRFGTAVQNDLDNVDSNAKTSNAAKVGRISVMNSWFPSQNAKGRYRDPFIKFA